MYEFRNLSDVSLDDLTATWNSAFSDYIVPMNMTPERLEAYFKVSGVDRSQSFGVFDNDTLVGMLVNAVDTFRGKTVAYDAMTGIVPEHRGQGLFSQLFAHTKTALKRRGITHYYLEVITANEKAYSIYQKKGGHVDRELTCLQGTVSGPPDPNVEVVISPLSAFPKEELSQYEPSFGNRMAALHRNIENYRVAHVEGGRSAVIFSKRGQIPQIMWEGTEGRDQLYAVLARLSHDFESLSIPNIPITETGLIHELLRIGFAVSVNQYEMCIEL